MARTATPEPKKRELVKEEKGVYALFSDGTIRINNVRCSYPHVGTPQENTTDDGKKTLSYSSVVLLPKATHKAAMQACLDAIRKMEAERSKGGKPFKYPAAKRFIKNGDAKDEDGDRLYADKPETEDHWFVSARERNRPRLRGPEIDPKTRKPRRLTPEQADQMFYGGCFVTVIIRPWAQDNGFGKRANAGLVAIQFIKDGDALGEGRISDDDVDESLEGVAVDAGDDWDTGDADDIGL